MEKLLTSAGFSFKKYKIGSVAGSYSFSADSDHYVGNVCFWPESTFEFQFNKADTGEVAVLETHEFESTDLVKKYLHELLKTRLR